MSCWRTLFVLFGSLGFVWAIAWYRWFRDSPASHPGVSAAEREHIESGLGNDEAVKVALMDGAHQGGAFDQLVASSWEEASFGNGAAPVTGAADTLQGHGNGARRTREDHPSRDRWAVL